MQFKLPAGVEMKAPRGFIYQPAASLAKVGFVVEGVTALLTGVKLKAGEETPVPVEVGSLRWNADISAITATLQVLTDGKATQSTTASVTEGSTKRTYGVEVDAVAGLRNVSVRLEGGEPIWTRGGAAPAGNYSLPDFSRQANLYLDQAKPTGEKVVLRFLVRSETEGSVRLSVSTPAFSLLQTQSWQNELDETLRVDRTVTLNFNAAERLELDEVAAPGGIARVAIRLDASGEFGPERLLGPVDAHDGHEFATVSPDYSLAQPFILAREPLTKSVRCAGVSLYAESDGEAELYVELQPDAGGAPASGAPLAKANVPFAPAAEGETQPWAFAPFQAPAELNLETPYWAVVKVARGLVGVGLRAAAGTNQPPVERQGALVNRGGQRWRAVSAAGRVALLGLVYLPDVDNQTAAVEIAVEGAAAVQRIDPGPQPQTVSLDLAGNRSKQAALLVRSYARGSFSVANVVQEYRPS